MKLKKIPRSKEKEMLSEKIADLLTVKPRGDIEDDHIFGTKPKTVSRVDFSSGSEDEAIISDFRKRNVNLLSELSKKYEGEVITRKELEDDSAEVSTDEDKSNCDNVINNISKQVNRESSNSTGSSPVQANSSKRDIHEEASDSEDFDSDDDSAESDDYSITQFQKNLSKNSSEESLDDNSDSAAEKSTQSDNEEEDEGYDISQMDEPIKDNFEHMKKQNISEEVKKGVSVRNQLLLWENLLEMRIHLQRCMNTANQMPMSEIYNTMKNNNEEFISESNAVKNNITNVLDK